MAYQSAEVHFDRLSGGGLFLVRLTGTWPRAHQGGQKRDMTQRAKAGYCPCCARPFHVAAPPRYEAGEISGHKAHGIQEREEHGSWAARFFTRAVYAHDFGHLPSTWRWAAQSLALKPAMLFGGCFGAVRKEHAAVSPLELRGRSGRKPQNHGPPVQSCSAPTGRDFAPSPPRSCPKQPPGNCAQSVPSARPSRRLRTSGRTSW